MKFMTGDACMTQSVERRVHRRALLSGCAAFALFPAVSVHAQDATYTYDELGRVTRVTYPNNRTVEYTYDAAGNRTQVVRAQPFTATITISGAGTQNLRTIANAAGYPGGDATITFVNSGTVTGDPASAGVDTGTWPTGYAVSLTLNNTGTIRGGGGAGNGGQGGDAVYARFALTINNAGGTLQAGGGGGGSGGTWRFTFYDAGGGIDHINCYYSGGGGGGWPNGVGGGPFVESFGNPTGSAGTGAAGTTGGGGAGGAGGAAGSGRTTGAGGGGGGVAATGSTGAAATGTITNPPIERIIIPPGSGGAPGYAVRKNGNAVTRTGGAVQGAEG